MPYPPESTSPRAHAAYASDSPAWWQRRPTPLTVAIGAAAALALAILVGLLLSPSMERATGDDAKAQSTAIPDGLIQFNLRPAGEAYQAPSADRVESAHLAVQAAFRAGGISELAHQGLLCFRALERKPSYGLLDYCIAFDQFAAALATRVAKGEQPSPASWFGSTGARHLNTARAIMGGQGDADARLLDLTQMTARRLGEAGPAIPPSPPPRPIAEEVPVPMAPLPATEAPRPPPRAPAARVVVPSQTLEPAPRLATRPQPPAPAPLPRAERIEPRAPATVSTPRAAASGPSFNCRYARSRSERMVCGDPALADADRRLNRAYRQAIQAGIPERELRRAQDRWLAVREDGASSSESLAAVYERRIAELQAMGR